MSLDTGAIYYVDCPGCGRRWSGQTEGIWITYAGRGRTYTLTPEAQVCPCCGRALCIGDRFTLVTPVGTKTYAIPAGSGIREEI